MMVSPLLADDADTVDVLGDDLDGGLCLTFADGGGLQGLLLGGASHFDCTWPAPFTQPKPISATARAATASQR